MPEWLTIMIAVGSGLVGGGVGWGVLTTRVGRLEKDGEKCASTEALAALSRRVDDNHDGVKESLSEIKETLRVMRDELHALRTERTNPGR